MCTNTPSRFPSPFVLGRQNLMRKKLIHLAAALCAAVFLLTAASAFAQQLGAASLRGVVTDPAGAVVAGARGKVVQKASGVERAAVTNEEGVYVFPSLPVGEYELS